MKMKKGKKPRGSGKMGDLGIWENNSGKKSLSKKNFFRSFFQLLPHKKSKKFSFMFFFSVFSVSEWRNKGLKWKKCHVAVEK